MTFVLDDAAAADKFEQQLTDSAIAIAAGPIGAHLLGKDVDIDIPPVESASFEYTHGGEVSIGTEGAGGYGNGSLELGNALGIKKNLTEGKPNSGDITAYYRIEGGLSGEAGLMLGQQAGGGLASDVVMAVIFDSSGKPKGLQVIATGSYEGQFQYGGRFRDLEAALQGLKGLDIKANAGEGQKIQLQLDLDLSDGDVANALLEFVQGVNPITGDPGNTAEAAAELGEALLDNGKAQIRTYDTSSTNGGAGIDLGVGGAGIDINTSQLRPDRRLRLRPRPGLPPLTDMRSKLTLILLTAVARRLRRRDERAGLARCPTASSSSPATAGRSPTRPNWQVSTVAGGKLAQGAEGTGGLAPQAGVASDPKPPPFDLALEAFNADQTLKRAKRRVTRDEALRARRRRARRG